MHQPTTIGSSRLDWLRLVPLVVALLGTSALSFTQATADVDLFVAVEDDAQRSRSDAATVRERLVAVDLELLDAARTNVGLPSTGEKVLRLNLFDDAMLDAVIDRTGPTSVGYWLGGHLAGDELSSVTFVVNGEVIMGTVRSLSAMYAIQSARNGVHAIRQIDLETLPSLEADSTAAGFFVATPPDHVLSVRLPGATRDATAEARPEEDGSRIDVLVVYTAAATDAVGGHEAIKARIDLWVTETNQAYADSGVIQRLNLVAALMVDYEEARPEGGLLAGSVDLNRLVRREDGYLDEIHDLRDRYAADIVTFVGHYADGTGGIAASWCEGHAPSRGCAPEAWMGFNLVDHEVSSTTFAHELGHTMGLNHDRYAATRCPQCSVPPEQDLSKWKPYPYAFGYVNQRQFEPDAPESSYWHTIMAYNSQCRDAGIRCGKVLRFSNPDLFWNGDPMGVPGDEPSSDVTGPADARRTLNETRHAIANFRVAPCLREGAQISLQSSNGQFLTAVYGGGGPVLANRDAPHAWEHFELMDLNGGCVESGDAVAFRTFDDFYLSAQPVGGAALEAMARSVGPRETFTVHRRAGQSEVRSGDFIALEAPDGHYVVAVQGGGGAVNAGGTHVEAWETFKITVAATNAFEGVPDALIFPDYVEGEGWSVQFVLGNLNPNRTAPVVVEVYDQQGERVSAFFDSGDRITLPALGSRILRSSGTGTIRRGWISVRSDVDSVRGLLTYKNASTGIEVGVEPVELGGHFALFVEESRDVGTGLAIFKPDPDSTIEFQIRDEEGNDPIGGHPHSRGNFQQLALTVPEWFSGATQAFPKEFRGLLFLRGVDGAPFAPVGLRFGKRTDSLSTVPVVPAPGKK